MTSFQKDISWEIFLWATSSVVHGSEEELISVQPGCKKSTMSLKPLGNENMMMSKSGHIEEMT